MSLFKRRKKVRPGPIDLPEYDSIEAIEERNNMLLGTEYESFLLDGTPRSAVLKRVSVGDPVLLRWWTPPGWSAELLFCFHSPTGLDLGSISRGPAEEVAQKYPGASFVGRVSELPTINRKPACRIEWKIYNE